MSTPTIERDDRIPFLPAAEIRRRFLEFFAERGHTIVPSASLIPAGDQTLLFVNSGMVPFKDVLTGVEKRDYTRAVNYQRSLRVAGKHNDFEEVGRTPRHHTLFEMLGNWSFGDYFKREAIHWAWQFLTRDLQLPPERIAATVYTTDDFAHDVWRDEIGLPPERLVRWGDFPAGDEKNWWRMADIGPCGPCSELHYDRGAHLSEGPECVPDHSEHCPRWLEIWNLVFMEFELHPDRSLTPLPAPGVDTGMGLERIASAVQQVFSNYDTDLFAAIHDKMRELLRHDPDAFEQERFSYQVIADHSRAVTFLVADGITPSNEGRGYVLRRILRRAVRHGRLLGRTEPFLGETAQVVIDTMSDAYPLLTERRDEILSVIAREEAAFSSTIESGLSLFFEAAVPAASLPTAPISQWATQLEAFVTSATPSIVSFADLLTADRDGTLWLGEVKSLASPQLEELAQASNTVIRVAQEERGLRAFRNAVAHGQASPYLVAFLPGTSHAAQIAADAATHAVRAEVVAKELAKTLLGASGTSSGKAITPTLQEALDLAREVNRMAPLTEGIVLALAPIQGDERAIEALHKAVAVIALGPPVPGRRPEELPPGAPTLPGDIAFKLHDTFGFPIDLTIEVAAEYGLRVDLAGFEDALAVQRQRSRAQTKAGLAMAMISTSVYNELLGRVGATEFVGYETTTAYARVVAILRDGTAYEELTALPEIELRAEAAADAELILDRTPFYAESGGQVGDIGVLRGADGDVVFTVTDTQRTAGTQTAGLTVHRGRLHGTVRVGETLTAEVDAERRAHTMRNHTGTHLLHRALRNVIGEGARQAGSLVHPDYLRFDYPGDRALTDDEKRAIETEVRRTIREDRPVSIEWMTMQDAQAAGADAFFDEKYGDKVRTIKVDGYSHELCGGTHCAASGQIGSFVITGERSIGSGMRRIEALTGAGADAWIAERLARLERAAEAVGARTPDQLEERIAALQEELRTTKQRLKAGGGSAGGRPKPADVAAGAEEVASGVRLATWTGNATTIDELKGYARDIRSALPSGVIALGLDADEPQLFVTVSEDLVGRGLAAGALVQAGATAIDGRGGGRPEMAQGKGTRREGLGDALTAIRAAVIARVTEA